LLTGYFYNCNILFNIRDAKVRGIDEKRRDRRKKRPGEAKISLFPGTGPGSPENQGVYQRRGPIFNGSLCGKPAFWCRFARMNMKIKSLLARPFSSYIYKSIQKGMTTAVGDQEVILKDLVKTGSKTIFGGEHHLGEVKGHEEFRQAVPIRDYEQFTGYIDQIKGGEAQCIMAGEAHLSCQEPPALPAG